MNVDDFKALTESGKFRAVTAQEIRADEWERKYRDAANRVKRHLCGIIDLAIEFSFGDEIVARIIKKSER